MGEHAYDVTQEHDGGDVTVAEDPRVEAAARALYEEAHAGHGPGCKRLPWSFLREEVREAYRKHARAALAAADEVQAPEVERLRSERDEALSHEAECQREHGDVHARAIAAEARYTALVEGVRPIARTLQSTTEEG